MKPEKNITHILHHQGEGALPSHAVSPPIFQTSIFCFPSYDEFRDALADEKEAFLYSRGNNPTVNLVEEKLAALEGAEKAKLVSSGVAAISSAVMAFLGQGDHVVCVRDCYSWTYYLFDTYLRRFGITVTFVDGDRVEDFEEAVQPNTKLIYLESPTTLTFKLQDLKAVAEFAVGSKIKTVIDNTWATPLYQNPVELGIDLAVHSASKYLGGHSDIIGGVIAGNEEDMNLIFEQEYLALGPTPDPMQAWLMLRGMRTLHVRVARHYKNALALTDFLENHAKVEDILYPFHPDFPQYELAQQQMKGGSGLFSFRLKSRKLSDVKTFVDSLRMFKRAVSWGGYESLIFPAAVKYADDDYIPADRISLIRCHAGLEDKDELIADLKQALDKL